MRDILSETSSAKIWLLQFKEQDRETAKLILDSLIYVSNEELIYGLRQLLQKYINNYKNEYIALFAIKEVINESNYWEDYLDKLDIKGKDGLGSESIITHFCTDSLKLSEFLLNHPSINEMKDKKCRHIVCINDIIGSGDQANRFSKWLYNHPTIKSWVSLKYVDFNILSYAGTLDGYNNIKENKIIKDILIDQYIDDGRSFWSDEEREKIKKVCRKYSPIRKYSLGYKNYFTFIYFSYKCPNTAPAILWSPNECWKAILLDRPEFGVDLRNFKSSGLDIKRAIDYVNMTKPIIFNRFNDEAKMMLIILVLFTHKKYSNVIISEMLGTSITEIDNFINELLSIGLIDKNKKITKMGKSLLHSARKIKIPLKALDLKNEFYYPSQLRMPI